MLVEPTCRCRCRFFSCLSNRIIIHLYFEVNEHRKWNHLQNFELNEPRILICLVLPKPSDAANCNWVRKLRIFTLSLIQDCKHSFVSLTVSSHDTSDLAKAISTWFTKFFMPCAKKSTTHVASDLVVWNDCQVTDFFLQRNPVRFDLIAKRHGSDGEAFRTWSLNAAVTAEVSDSTGWSDLATPLIHFEFQPLSCLTVVQQWSVAWDKILPKQGHIIHLDPFCGISSKCVVQTASKPWIYSTVKGILTEMRQVFCRGVEVKLSEQWSGYSQPLPHSWIRQKHSLFVGCG